MTFAGETVMLLTAPKEISYIMPNYNDYRRQKDRGLTKLWKAQAPTGQFRKGETLRLINRAGGRMFLILLSAFIFKR